MAIYATTTAFFWFLEPVKQNNGLTYCRFIFKYMLILTGKVTGIVG